jgi:exonuclease VII large subunit
MKTSALFLLVFLFCVPSALIADEYYTWTDENGVTHITNTPHPSAAGDKKVTTKTFEENTTASRPEDKPETYQQKIDRIKEEMEEQKRQNKEESEDRMKKWKKKRCADARLSEKLYRHRYINARNTDTRLFYKRELERIESICEGVD